MGLYNLTLSSEQWAVIAERFCGNMVTEKCRLYGGTVNKNSCGYVAQICSAANNTGIDGVKFANFPGFLRDFAEHILEDGGRCQVLFFAADIAKEYRPDVLGLVDMLGWTVYQDNVFGIGLTKDVIHTKMSYLPFVLS